MVFASVFQEPTKLLSSILVADRDSGATGAVDCGFVAGPTADVIQELFIPVGVAGVVGCEAATLRSFGSRSLKYCVYHFLSASRKTKSTAPQLFTNDGHRRVESR